MNTSLTVLIILIVIVIAVILLNTDTCKTTLASLFKKKQVVKPKLAKAKKVSPKTIKKPQRVRPQAKAAKPAARIRTLGGSLEEMFSPQEAGAEEFGLTEETLNSLAEAYAREHFDVPEETETRHRSYRRSEIENAEAMLQQSFVQLAAGNLREDTEDFVTESFRRNIMSAAERGESLRRERGQLKPNGDQ